MTILDAFENAEHKNKIALLATLIKLSLVDGELDEREMKIIERVARNYGLFDHKDLTYIMKNYEKFSLETTFEYDKRIEQLFYLTKIIYADKKIDSNETKILKNSIVALGFSPKKLDRIYKTAIKKIIENVNISEFIKSIKKTCTL